MSSSVSVFSLATIRDEIVKKTLHMNNKRVIKYDPDKINTAELKKILGNDAYNAMDKSTQKHAIRLNVHALDMTEFKKYAAKNVLSYLDNFYFLGITTGGLFPLREISKLDSHKVRTAVEGIVNHHTASSRSKETIRFWKMYTSSNVSWFNWMCNANEYVLFDLLNADKNTFFDNISQCMHDHYEVFPSVIMSEIKEAINHRDISAYVLMVLFSLLKERQDNHILGQIANNERVFHSRTEEDFITFQDNILSKTGFLTPTGTLSVLHQTRNVSNLPFVDLYTLILASDIYFRQGNYKMAESCSLEAYNRGNRTVAAYNLGYYAYMRLLTQKHITSNDRDTALDSAYKYLSESAYNMFPAAYTSLGNLCALMLKNQDPSYMNKNIYIYENLLKLAQNTDDKKRKIVHSKNIEALSSNLETLKHFFYEKAASLGNLDAMYSCIRDVEKRLPIDIEKANSPQEVSRKIGEATKEIAKWHNKLVEYRHPKGVNSYCCYVLSDLGIDDFQPSWGIAIKSKADKAKIYKKYNEYQRKMSLPVMDELSTLALFHDVCFYDTDQFRFFWPMYHFAFLYNRVNTGNSELVYSIEENSKIYEFDTIIEILETALSPKIFNKELFTPKKKKEAEILGYKLLYKVLARACDAGEDIAKIEYHLLENRQKFDMFINDFDKEDRHIISQYVKQTDISSIQKTVEEIKDMMCKYYNEK